MPRLDDLGIKLKELKTFKRKSLRPWDNFEDFKPSDVSHAELTSIKTGESIGKQLVNNRETISKPISKQETPPISKQLVNNRETIGKQEKSNKETISKPISKQETPPISKQLVNQWVNEKPNHTQTLEHIKSLVGLQRKLFFYIVENCKERGLLYTSQITNESFRILLNTNAHIVKTTTQRLIKKRLVAIEKGKKGKGGYKIFLINEIIRNAAIEAQIQLGIGKQLVNHLVNDIGKQLVNNKETIKGTTSLSSSSIYNKTTTTEADAPKNNHYIDVDQLNNIGLSQAHIMQLTKQGKLTSDQIQDSINYFAFDLAHNDKAKELKKSPLDFFMGILRQGNPYAAPSNYESQESKAMRLYLKSKEAVEKKQKELEEKFKESLLQEWVDTLTDSQLMDFYVAADLHLEGVPDKVQLTMKKRNALENAKQYFDTEIWPSKRKALLSVKSDVASQEEV